MNIEYMHKCKITLRLDDMDVNCYSTFKINIHFYSHCANEYLLTLFT